MYKIVKTKRKNIDGVWIWLECPNYSSQSQSMIDAAKTCNALNETCDEDECYHLRLV